VKRENEIRALPVEDGISLVSLKGKGGKKRNSPRFRRGVGAVGRKAAGRKGSSNPITGLAFQNPEGRGEEYMSNWLKQ